MTGPAPKIVLRDVHKAFGTKKILDGIGLSVAAGESLVIIGGSGLGKSVLLKCILGLIQPDRGSIQVDGEELITLSTRRRERVMHKFSMLFQGAALFDSLPVWQNVAFGLLQRGHLGRVQAKDLAIEKLRTVGLGPEVAGLFPAELSGGMQKRVGLARAVAEEPEIIFFDEPTTGLDPIMANVINDLIVQCAKDPRVTTLSITHDVMSAQKIADRIAMLWNGRIIWEGPASKVFSSGNPYVDQFVHGRPHGPITHSAGCGESPTNGLICGGLFA